MKYKLKSFFMGKSKKESIQTFIENIEKYKNFTFEWIKGDIVGSFERIKDVSGEDQETSYINFQSGRRIKYDLLNEFMLYYPASNNEVVIDEEPTAKKKEAKNETLIYSTIKEKQNDDKKKEDTNPISNLLRHQKENLVNVSINISLNLPSIALYSVLSESFENAEDEIIKFSISTLEIEEIKKSVSDAIKEYYGNSSSK